MLYASLDAVSVATLSIFPAIFHVTTRGGIDAITFNGKVCMRGQRSVTGSAEAFLHSKQVESVWKLSEKNHMKRLQNSFMLC